MYNRQFAWPLLRQLPLHAQQYRPQHRTHFLQVALPDSYLHAPLSANSTQSLTTFSCGRPSPAHEQYEINFRFDVISDGRKIAVIDDVSDHDITIVIA